MSGRAPGIMARIRRLPGGASGEEPTSPTTSSGEREPLSDQVEQLRARVSHLEQLVQGLQDSVHRGSERQDKRLSDIEKRLEPSTMAAALSKDARERGL